MKQRTRAMHSGDDINGLMSMANHKKNEDESDNSIQLHKIRQPEHYIEAQVQAGDTLQAISLRFYCSVSELKRINQIHKDNEIFARQTIKVPITPYSILTETIPGPSQPVPSTSTAHVASNVHNVLVIENNNEKQADNFTIDCNEVVLNSNVAPSVTPYTDADTTEVVTEDTELLPRKEKVSVEAVVVTELTSHGADFGLKWFHLVCVLLALCVVAPLWIIIKQVVFSKHEHGQEHSP